MHITQLAPSQLVKKLVKGRIFELETQLFALGSSEIILPCTCFKMKKTKQQLYLHIQEQDNSDMRALQFRHYSFISF